MPTPFFKWHSGRNGTALETHPVHGPVAAATGAPSAGLQKGPGWFGGQPASVETSDKMSRGKEPPVQLVQVWGGPARTLVM